MKDVTVEWLKTIDNLKDVPDEQLQWFIGCSSVMELSAGESLFKLGDVMPGPFVILSGKVVLSVPHGKELHEAGAFEAGSIGGYLPFSRGKLASIVTEAVDDVRYLQLPLGRLDEMIRSQFALTQTLVHVMANRIRDIHLKPRAEVAAARGSDRLERLDIRSLETNEVVSYPADALYIFIGAKPFTEWIGLGILKDEKGVLLTGRDLKAHPDYEKIWKQKRDPYLLETCCPGVFAAGDVRAGAMNRVASAVGEGSMAISFVHKYLAEVK